MWTKVAKTGDLQDGQGVSVELGGHCIALFKHGGKFKAIDGNCPHRGGPLAQGSIEDGEVVCPWHAWAFNIDTGKSRVLPGQTDLKTYPVKVEGDDVLIDA